MSHTSKYSVAIKDVNLFCKIAEDVFDYQVTRGNHEIKLFGRKRVQAVASILIDGWRYPIAINSEGEVLYDHFGSQRNTMEKLGMLMQRYSTELIIENLPMDKVQSYFGTEVKDTGEYKIVVEY